MTSASSMTEWPQVPQDAEAIVRLMSLAMGAGNDDPSKLPFNDRVICETTTPEERREVAQRAVAKTTMRPFSLPGDLRIATASLELLGLPRIKAIKHRAALLAWRQQGLDATDRKALDAYRRNHKLSLGLMLLSHLLFVTPLAVLLLVAYPSWTDVGTMPFWGILAWSTFAIVVLFPLWWWEILFPIDGTLDDKHLLLTVSRVLECGPDPKRILHSDGSVDHPELLKAMGRRVS